MTPMNAMKFLREAAGYFERRPTHGEDIAYWSNAYNAKNCREIADLIADLRHALVEQSVILTSLDVCDEADTERLTQVEALIMKIDANLPAQSVKPA